MQKELIIAAILGLLLLAVLAQSLQLNSLNANLATAKTLQASAGTGAQTTQQNVVSPQQSSVPTQVGGC